MSVGGRIFEERSRLEISQPALCEKTGLNRVTQINYEKNHSSPNARYLSQLAALGFDVLYIVTGERPDANGKHVILSSRHSTLLQSYAAATDEGKKIIEGVAHLAANQVKQPETKDSHHVHDHPHL